MPGVVAMGRGLVPAWKGGHQAPTGTGVGQPRAFLVLQSVLMTLTGVPTEVFVPL